VKIEIRQTLINSNANSTAISEAIGSSNSRNGSGIGNIQRNLCGKLSLEGVFAGPGIESSLAMDFNKTFPPYHQHMAGAP
jgi:hypothetical protein